MENNKFKNRITELKDNLEKNGRTPNNSKLYKSIKDKMENFNKPITK